VAHPGAAWRHGGGAPVGGAKKLARTTPSSSGSVVVGALASVPRCACLAWRDHLGPSLVSCGSPAMVADVLLLIDKLPAMAVCWLLRNARLHFTGGEGGRSPAQVKTLLGIAVAEHSDTCGCYSLLGGVFLGRIIPPFVPGETLGLLCRIGQWRHFSVVPFLKALCWLRGLRGSQRWWPRRSSARLGSAVSATAIGVMLRAVIS
jgi:hypothetical protein